MKAQGYLVRHLKRGVIIDCVYLERPTREVLVSKFGIEDVDKGSVFVVPTEIETSREEIVQKLDQVPSKVIPAPEENKVMRVTAAASGMVVNPQ